MLLRKVRRAILFLTISFFILPSARGTHILGGEISFDFIEFKANNSVASYEFNMVLYRDPTGVAYPGFVNFGIYQLDDSGRWIPFEVITNVPRSPISDIPRIPDPCKTRDLPNERVQSVTYSFIADLDIVGKDYLIAYQACCRNPTINNIVDADIGAVYDVVLSSETVLVGNNSPKFKGFPPIFVCSGYDLEYDHSADDIEGDELRYSFCTSNFPGYDDGTMPAPTCCGCVTPDPQICTPPFLDVIYAPPFSADNPMGGSPQVRIDNNSGFIIGRPDLIGSYIVSVCVEEFRNGVLLSKIRRDFEFNVVKCDENLIASLETSDELTLGDDGIYHYEDCHDTSVEFINNSTDLRFIRNYTWNFFDENEEVINISGPNLRNVNLDFPSTGNYTGYMKIDDGIECQDSIPISINIIPHVDLYVELEYDTCVAGPISISYSGLSGFENYDWKVEVGDGTAYNELIGEHEYSELGTYALQFQTIDEYGCVNVTEETIDWIPFQIEAPDTIVIDTLICYEDSLLVQNEWVNRSGIYLDYIESIFSGCDSIVQLIQLEVTEKNESYYAIELCKGETYDFGNEVISSPGQYRDTLNGVNGCDSISILDVIVNGLDTTTILKAICSNEYFEFGGEQITRTGTYLDLDKNINSCDSLIILDIEVSEVSEVFLSEIICDGGYFSAGGQDIMEQGDYQFVLENSNGCDSTVNLSLELLDGSQNEFTDTICRGEVYPFGAIDLTLPGIYFDTLTNTNGCDSIVILDLTVGQNLSRINADDELDLDYGAVVYLEPIVQGGDLLSADWYISERHISEALTVAYLVEKDDWLYFESTNVLYCVSIDSVFIRSIVDIDIYIPNIFTPDGDGINDIFNIGASNTVVQSQLSIYDRWGNSIYVGDVTTDRNIETGWDGTYAGKRVEEGTYVYVVSVEFINGTSEIYTGSINLLR